MEPDWLGASVEGMPIEPDAEYYGITICFPAFVFVVIVLYVFFRGRFKRGV